MGRPSLGSAARNVLLATKGTQAEANALIEKYGSVYAGMRFGLRLALESGMRSEPRGQDSHGVWVDEVERAVAEATADYHQEVRSRSRQSGKTTEVQAWTDEMQKRTQDSLDSAEQGLEELAQHRHRRGKELDPVYEGGSKKRRYACTVEGCEEVLS